MIRDLANTNGQTNVKGKACIIGAGIAGLLLASRLRSFGMRVITLESGPRETPEGADPLNAVVQLAQVYNGGEAGRCRGLGGTSTRWGGQLVPIRREDIVARPHIGLPAWPISSEAFMCYLPEIEELFGLCKGTYEHDFVKDCGANGLIPCDDPSLTPRFSKVPAFKRRNIATLLTKLIHNDADIEVWLNATVVTFEFSRETGRLKSVTATDVHGRSLRAEAELFVICAGAIESTRLLLMLDAANDGRVFEGCNVLGRYLHDHISVPLAELVPTHFDRFNHMFGQHFVGTTMRSTRLELRSSVQARDGVAAAYGHVSMELPCASGFAVLRKFLQSRQKNEAGIDPWLFLKFIRQVPYLSAVGFWRFYHNQFYWSRDATFQLHVVAEQVPHAENRIVLSGERDALGVPMAAIDWRLREAECRTFRSYLNHYDKFWHRHGLERIARLKLYSPPDDLDGSTLLRLRAGDIYHPAGSTRMGGNGRDAVVNGDLRVFALRNLWVLSTSVFPSLGTANPTLTLMLMTLRLGNQLSKES